MRNKTYSFPYSERVSAVLSKRKVAVLNSVSQYTRASEPVVNWSEIFKRLILVGHFSICISGN